MLFILLLNTPCGIRTRDVRWKVAWLRPLAERSFFSFTKYIISKIFKNFKFFLFIFNLYSASRESRTPNQGFVDLCLIHLAILALTPAQGLEPRSPFTATLNFKFSLLIQLEYTGIYTLITRRTRFELVDPLNEDQRISNPPP